MSLRLRGDLTSGFNNRSPPPTVTKAITHDSCFISHDASCHIFVSIFNKFPIHRYTLSSNGAARRVPVELTALLESVSDGRGFSFMQTHSSASTSRIPYLRVSVQY